MLNNIAIVLVETSHPGNIGATARAMKNMGLTNLRLVNPKKFPHAEASARAAGADDILQQAKLYSDLQAAIADCHVVMGTSARERTLPWPLLNPKQCAAEIQNTDQENNIAIIFGRERIGLTNEELALCQFHINIPTNPDYSSLNVAAAVQIIAYELYAACYNSEPQQLLAKNDRYASNEEIEQFYQHLEKTLREIDFFKPTEASVMQRLRRLFSRSRLEHLEINVLRGILSAVNKIKSSSI